MKKILLTVALFCSLGAHADRYDQVVSRLEGFQSDAPQWVQKISLGVNDQGREIIGLKIQGPKSSVPRLLVGTHHGNEGLSADLSLEFIGKLIQEMKNPSGDFEEGLLRGIYYVFPVLNITGYVIDRRQEKNSKGVWVDPNRDYRDPCGQGKKDHLLTSTRLLADFIRNHDIRAAVTVHGYIGTFTYPWGTYTDQPRTEDHHEFDHLLSVAVGENGYQTGTHGEVIYPTVGAFEDWVYYELGVWASLLELRSDADLNRDSRAVLRFFALSPTERSQHHAHLGNCTKIQGEVRSRP